MEHAQGEVLAGRYELRALIARGPTALTYLALDRKTGRKVGVRHWSAGAVDDAKAAAELARQVALSNAVHHVHLPRCLEQFAIDTSAGTERYLVQDAEGQSLTDWSRERFRDEAEMRVVATALLRVLDVLHTKGFVHGRVSADEVLRRGDGRVYLTGAAAEVDAHGGASADLRALGQTLLAITPFPRLSSELRSWLEWLLSSDDQRGFASAADALRALQKTLDRNVRKFADYAMVAVLIVAASGGFWALRSRPFLARQRGEAASVLGMAIADTRFAPKTASTEPQLRLSYVVSMTGHWSVAMQVAFDHDGKRLASASFDGAARVWNANDGSALATFTHRGKVGTVAFMSGDRLISGGGPDVRIWNAANGELVRTLAGDGKQVTQVRATPDGKYVVAVGFEGKLRVFDAGTGELVRSMQQPPRAMALAVDDRGEHVACAGSDGVVRVFRLADGGLERELHGHTSTVDALAFSADGHTLVSSADDHSVRVWHLPTNKSMLTLQGHRDEVWAVAVDPTGTRIASGSKDGELRIWDMYTGKLLLSQQADARGVTSLAYSPDGQRLAVSGGSQRVDVYALIVQRPSWQPPPITAPIKPTPPPSPPKDARPEVGLLYQARALLDASEGGNGLREADALLQRALAQNPQFAAAYVERARIAYKAGYMSGQDYQPEALEQADQLLKRALELEPNSYDAYLRLGYLRMYQKNYLAAMQAAERGEQLRAGDAETQWLFMCIADRQDQDEQVMLHARAMVESSPTTRQLAGAYGMLQRIYEKRGEYDASDTMYRSAINLEPDSAWSKGNYAHFLIRRERYDDAITWARAALAQMDYGMAHVTLGEAYASKARVALAKGKRKEVAEALTSAFIADPRSAEGHYVRGLVLRADRDESGARREFEAALAADPQHKRAADALHRR